MYQELIVHVIELFSEKMFMSCEGVKLFSEKLFMGHEGVKLFSEKLFMGHAGVFQFMDENVYPTNGVGYGIHPLCLVEQGEKKVPRKKLQCLEILLGKVKLKGILMSDDVIRNKSLLVLLGLKKINFSSFISTLEMQLILSDGTDWVTSNGINIQF